MLFLFILLFKKKSCSYVVYLPVLKKLQKKGKLSDLFLFEIPGPRVVHYWTRASSCPHRIIFVQEVLICTHIIFICILAAICRLYYSHLYLGKYYSHLSWLPNSDWRWEHNSLPVYIHMKHTWRKLFQLNSYQL